MELGTMRLKIWIRWFNLETLDIISCFKGLSDMIRLFQEWILKWEAIMNAT